LKKIGLIGLSALALTVAGCGGDQGEKAEKAKYQIVCQDPESTHAVSRRFNYSTSYGWFVIYDINGRVYYRSTGTCTVSRVP
jgi:hypothetical protein